MQKIIEYLTDHPKYANVLYASLAIIAVAIILLFVFRAIVAKKRENAEKSAPRANAVSADGKNESLRPAVEDKTAADTSDEIKNSATTEALAENSVSSATPVSSATSAAEQENAKTGEPTIERKNCDKSAEEPTEHGDRSEPQAVWQIEENGGTFSAKLISQSGNVLLSSDDYTSLSGVKSGVDTLKNNVASSNYAINVNRNGKFYFKVFSTANRLLCVSGEFNTRNECENAFEAARRASKNANLKDPD